MDASEIAYAGIAAQAQLIRDGEISSVELVEVYLERIARLHRQLNCFRSVYAKRVRLEAQQADARRAGGDERPLLGVPFAVKEDMDIAGEVTAIGTNAVERVAAADSEVVRRLRDAGALVIGKTNVPELTQWPFTETATNGVTRNPWDLQRTPGGSSGGSAAAVAAGLVGAALGSDGLGSIRIPAAWCGLLGLKPQRDRVPVAPLQRPWYGLSVYGLLARRAADTALFHDVLSAPSSERDAPAPSAGFAAAARREPGRLRIAWSAKAPPGAIIRLDSDCERALSDTVELLRARGHELVQRDPDYGLNSMPSGIARYLRGIHDDAAGLEHPERLERRTRGMARLGGLIPGGLLARALAHEQSVSDRLGLLFADHDALLTPATATAPPRIGQLEGRGALWTFNAVAAMVPYTGIWNITGQPAVAVPAGFGGDGLPRSVQIVGRPGEEATLLSLAAQLERERPTEQQRPPGFE